MESALRASLQLSKSAPGGFVRCSPLAHSITVVLMRAARLLVTCLLALGLVLGPSVPAWADALSSLPPPWNARLLSIPEADLSGAEPGVRSLIESVRAEVAGLLASADTPPETLADAYGRLAALYDVHDVPAAAKVGYANAIALQPDEFRWHYYAGWLDLRDGRPEGALHHFERARRYRPTYAALDLRIGQALYDAGRLAEARSRFEIAFHRVGQRAMAAYYLGQIALQAKDYGAAAGHFEEALRIEPQASRVRYPLAQALRGAGREAEARAQLAQQGDRLPAVDDSVVAELEALKQGGRVHFSRGMQALKARDLAGALEAFRDGLERMPDNSAARVSYARLLYLNGDVAGAKAELQRVLRDPKPQPFARFLMGLLLEGEGDGQAAEKAYREAIRLDPKQAGARAFLGGRLYRQGRFKEAAEQFAAAAKANPDLTTLPVYRLMALARAGVSDKVLLAELEALLRERPKEPLWRYALARLLAASVTPAVRDTARALEVAQGLVAESPVPPHLEALALAEAGRGEFERARTLMTQVQMAALWQDAAQQARISGAITRLAAGKLPQPAWQPGDPLLEPPPFDALRSFRDYPAAVPY